MYLTTLGCHIYNYTASNAHLVLLCVLLDYVPEWSEMLKLDKKNVTNFATIVTTTLHQMHALFCCVCVLLGCVPG